MSSEFEQQAIHFRHPMLQGENMSGNLQSCGAAGQGSMLPSFKMSSLTVANRQVKWKGRGTFRQMRDKITHGFFKIADFMIRGTRF